MEKIYKGEIQRLLPIFQAMADGKIIQVSENGNDWLDIDGEEEGLFINTLIDNPQCYRIKPESKYRPFANAEECLNEMQKHQPFGWVKIEDLYRNIANVTSCSITFADNEARDVEYEQAFKNYTFADGNPFGVKVEK